MSSRGRRPRAATGALGARDVALEVLEAVDEEGAFTALSLRSRLDRSGLDPRESAFATQLVYGTLRWLLRLDWHLQLVLDRPLASVDPRVRNVLRLGLYQALFLQSVPGPVAVNESVELARRWGEGRAAALVNAVLRRALSLDAKRLLPSLREHPVDHLSVRYSHPPWLVERWWNRLGYPEVVRLLWANNRWPPMVLRANRLRTTGSELIARLRATGLDARPGRWVPEAVRVSRFPAPERSQFYREGLFQVQDESSMLVAYAVAPRPGDLVLDLCSAPGGKSTHLAEHMGNVGRVIAFDPHPGKLRLVAGAAARLGLSIVETQVADARTVTGWQADRVLVDAPCSGLGVIRRRPELRWRQSPERIAELVKLQREILANAARLVKPGGILVYSTCTTEPEENEGNLRWFLQNHPSFHADSLLPYLPPDAARVLLERVPREEGRARSEEGAMIQLWPHRHGTDGFFLARLRRRESG